MEPNKNVRAACRAAAIARYVECYRTGRLVQLPPGAPYRPEQLMLTFCQN